ncbi:MAG: copper chaperone PCu(A)C [Salinarimonas sp.]
MTYQFRKAAIAAITLTATLGLALAATTAQAETFTIGDITIDNPWTRVTPGGARVAGGYMIITNNGSETDRLIGGTSEIAPRFEVHSMEMVDGVARMAEVEGGLEIPPGGSVALEPGSYHVMFMNLAAPVTMDAPVSGTLVFERAGEVEITYAVAPMGSPQAPGGHGHGHSHGHSHGHGHGHGHGQKDNAGHRH